MNSELHSNENIAKLARLLLCTWGYDEAITRAKELIRPSRLSSYLERARNNPTPLPRLMGICLTRMTDE